MAARQQVPAVGHLRRAGAGSDGADSFRHVPPGRDPNAPPQQPPDGPRPNADVLLLAPLSIARSKRAAVWNREEVQRRRSVPGRGGGNRGSLPSLPLVPRVQGGAPHRLGAIRVNDPRPIAALIALCSKPPGPRPPRRTSHELNHWSNRNAPLAWITVLLSAEYKVGPTCDRSSHCLIERWTRSHSIRRTYMYATRNIAPSIERTWTLPGPRSGSRQIQSSPRNFADRDNFRHEPGNCASLGLSE